MVPAATTSNKSRRPDRDLVTIARYVAHYEIKNAKAFETARYCLIDSLSCAILALRIRECTKLLGPIVPGTIVPNGARVPGTEFVLDPVKLQGAGSPQHRNLRPQFESFYVSVRHGLYHVSLAIEHPERRSGSTEVQIISLADQMSISGTAHAQVCG